MYLEDIAYTLSVQPYPLIWFNHNLKAVYGLAEASRLWFLHLTDLLF